MSVEERCILQRDYASPFEEYHYGPYHYALGELIAAKTKYGWSRNTEYKGKEYGVYTFSLPSLRDKWVVENPNVRMKVKAVVHIGYKGHRHHVYENAALFMG